MWPEHVWRRWRQLFFGFERVKDFCPSWIRGESATDERKLLLSESERGGRGGGGRGRGRERELPVWNCACSEWMCTDTCRSASLALILWRALCQSGPCFPSLPLSLFPFLSPLYISCPFFSASPFLHYFSSCPFLFSYYAAGFLSPRQKRCTADRGELNGWMDGCMHCWSKFSC